MITHKRFIRTSHILLIAMSLLLGFMMALLINRSASAQTAQPQVQQPTQRTAPRAEVTYRYVAQPGDSYSVLARKAVQSYGKETKTNISNARIIFAETGLTQQVGSPLLEIGQIVQISQSSVKQWVDRAKTLSAAQEQAWQYYAQFANFNTNAAGEAPKR